MQKWTTSTKSTPTWGSKEALKSRPWQTLRKPGQTWETKHTPATSTEIWHPKQTSTKEAPTPTKSQGWQQQHSSQQREQQGGGWKTTT